MKNKSELHSPVSQYEGKLFACKYFSYLNTRVEHWDASLGSIVRLGFALQTSVFFIV